MRGECITSTSKHTSECCLLILSLKSPMCTSFLCLEQGSSNYTYRFCATCFSVLFLLFCFSGNFKDLAFIPNVEKLITNAMPAPIPSKSLSWETGPKSGYHVLYSLFLKNLIINYIFLFNFCPWYFSIFGIPISQEDFAEFKFL